MIRKDVRNTVNIVIATIKSWNIKQAELLKNKYRDIHKFTIITNREELTTEYLEEFQPDYIFFPHWSYIIPAEIYDRFPCVVFHMTDLPFGRGGSPLQNLIVRGIKDTKISAIRVTEGIDAGPVYWKEPLSLDGSAEEIFERAAGIIFQVMIPKIMEEKPVPVPQSGEVVAFKRRKPEESEIGTEFSPEQVYDYIRMLDAEGYPKAFLDYGAYRLEFTGAVKDGDEVRAEVVFRRKDHE